MWPRFVPPALAMLAALAAGPANAQPRLDETRPFAFFSPKPTLDPMAKDAPQGADVRAVSLNLRPNVEQQAYVFVYNPTGDPKAVNVILSAGTQAGGELARTAQPVAVPANGVVRVALAAKQAPAAPPPPPAPAAAGQPPAPPPPAAPAGVKLPPNTLLVLRTEEVAARAGDVVRPPAGGAAPAAAATNDNPHVIDVLPPSDNRFRVTAESPGDGQLAVTVEFLAGGSVLSSAPAKVALDLRPDLNPWLDLAAAKGTLAAEVPAGEKATLFVEGVKFIETAGRRTATVAVSIDGFDRARLIRTGFQGGNPEFDTEPFVNVRLPVAAASPGKPALVTAETANNVETPLVLSVDRTGRGQFDVLRKFPTDRRKETYVKAGGADDAVVFTPVVEDWTHEFPTAGVVGKRSFRLEAGGKRDQKTLVLDRTPPRGVLLVGLPKDYITGRSLVLEGVGQDPESDVKAVYFFVGEPPSAEGKPAGAGKVIRAIPVADPKAAAGEAGGEFPVRRFRAVELLRLPEQRGEWKIGVLFVNGVGLATASEELTIFVRDPEAEKAKKGTGSIAGTVMQGYRPQPGLPVELKDEAGKATLKATTTDAAGKFKFEDVPPGTYQVSSVKKADANARGQKSVTVVAGDKPAEVALNVLR